MGELKEVHAVLPEMVKSYTPLWVIFSVKNESSPKLPIIVTRKKNCDCKMENSASLTRWVKKYNCPHREMLSIDYQINPVVCETFYLYFQPWMYCFRTNLIIVLSMLNSTLKMRICCPSI